MPPRRRSRCNRSWFAPRATPTGAPEPADRIDRAARGLPGARDAFVCYKPEGVLPVRYRAGDREAYHRFDFGGT